MTVSWKAWQGLLALFGSFLIAGAISVFLPWPAASSAALGITFIFVAWLIARNSEDPWRTLGLRKPGARWGWYLLLALAVFWGASALFSLSGAESEQQGLLQELGPWPVQLALVVLLAPFAEELIFRGVLFAGFAQRMPVLLAAFLSALLFALPHLPSGAVVLPLIGVLGFVLALLYYRTQSLWPPILLHALNNAIALVALSG